jgi:hypothetical protein
MDRTVLRPPRIGRLPFGLPLSLAIGAPADELVALVGSCDAFDFGEAAHGTRIEDGAGNSLGPAETESEFFISASGFHSDKLRALVATETGEFGDALGTVFNLQAGAIASSRLRSSTAPAPPAVRSAR